MRSYFRLDDAAQDPRRILDPEHQWSAPWGGGDSGRCDKCGGAGLTPYRCSSCLDGPDDDCPACGGRVHFRDTCPVCRGTGEIDGAPREGVSVFPRVEGLLRYLARTEADLEGCVLVELRGTPSGDVDFDADEGALLVRPTEVVGTRPAMERA